MPKQTKDHAIILSRDYVTRNKIVEMLELEGVESLMSDELSDLPLLIAAEDTPDFLFIDIDGFGGPALLYDTLRGFRDEYSETSLILLSEEFETDEFGTHRIMLADVSVRLPLTFSNLSLALLQAPVNNEIWNERVEKKTWKDRREAVSLARTEPPRVVRSPMYNEGLLV